MATPVPSLPKFTKRPSESRVQSFDLRAVLKSGAELSNASVTATKLGRTTPADDITPDQISASGTIVQARFPGGTDEEDYLITVTADVSYGGTVEEYFVLRCRDGIEGT